MDKGIFIQGYERDNEELPFYSVGDSYEYDDTFRIHKCEKLQT